MAGELTTVKVAHFKLSYSRMPFSIAYPRETQEMVFDSNDEAFNFFDGCCGKGIYDNMSTAVDAVLRGKERKFNKTFLQMCSHHMAEPIACSPAAGWEKGQVENLVKENREYSLKPRLEVADFDELNARLKTDAVERARELRHPENPDLTVWEMFQQEQAFLTPLQKPFVGFCEKTVAVNRTCLINFDRNKYSVDSRAVGGPVQLQVYATRIVLRQNGEIVGEHERSFGRNKIIFNPWHYVPFVNWHTRESHIQRSFRTHCWTEGQLGGAAAGPARSSRRKSTLLAVPSLLDEKELRDEKKFLQQMTAGPLDRRFPLFVGLRCMLFHSLVTMGSIRGKFEIAR